MGHAASIIGLASAINAGDPSSQEQTTPVPSEAEQEAPTSESSVPAPTANYTGFLDFNGYFDSRKAATFTLNTLINFPFGFQYFSLVNYFNPSDASRIQDLEGYLAEHNLRFGPLDKVPLDAAMQWFTKSWSIQRPSEIRNPLPCR